jgi:hypothetical protein
MNLMVTFYPHQNQGLHELAFMKGGKKINLPVIPPEFLF